MIANLFLLLLWCIAVFAFLLAIGLIAEGIKRVRRWRAGRQVSQRVDPGAVTAAFYEWRDGEVSAETMAWLNNGAPNS